MPLFERTELFARGIGDETDIVKKEMYTFEDRGGDSLTLRPEATACVLRAYIEHGFQVRAQAGPALHNGPDVSVRAPPGGPLPAVPSGQCRGSRRDAPRARCRGDRHADGLLRCPRPGRSPRATRQLDRGCGDAARLRFEARRVPRAAPFRALRRMPGADRPKPPPDPRLQDCPAVSRSSRRRLRSSTRCRPKRWSTSTACAGASTPWGSITRSTQGWCADSTTTCARPSRCSPRSWARRMPWRAGGAMTASSRSSVARLIPESASRSASSGSSCFSGRRSALRPSRPAHSLWVRPRCNASCPAARRARQGGVPVELGYGLRKLPRELERANRLGATWAVIAGDNELARGEAVVREMSSGIQRHVPLEALADELLRLGSTHTEPRSR